MFALLETTFQLVLDVARNGPEIHIFISTSTGEQ